MRTLLRALAALTLLLGAAAARAQPVKFGELGILADAPVYIAIERGFFREAGIEVELERFAGAAQATAPLATNRLQVAGGGVSAALFNAFTRDWPVRIAFGRTGDRPGFSSDTLILRSDLRERVRRPRDLKGMRIAVNVPAGALHYMVGRMLEQDGLGLGDVELVFMPWPSMGPAFESRAMDAGAVVEPFAALYAQRGIAVPFRRAAEVLTNPPLDVSVVLMSLEWANARPEQARAFALGYVRGMRVYHDAMRGGPERAAVVALLTRRTSMTNPAQYDQVQWSYADPNAEIDLASLRDQQAFLGQIGALQRPQPVEGMIDRRFLDQALQQLGRVH